MKKNTTLLAVLAASLLAANATQPLLTTESPEFVEDFDGVTVTGASGVPWVPGATFPGFYAVLEGSNAPDSMPNIIARNVNGQSSSSTFLYSFTRDDDRSIGFVVGASTRDAMVGLRLVNDSDQVINAIKIGYQGHQWFDSAAMPKTIRLAFRNGDPETMDNSAITAFLRAQDQTLWVPIPAGEFETPVQKNSGEVDALSDGKRTVIATQGFLDWKPGKALWLRWDFSGQPWSRLSIDDVRVKATEFGKP